MATRPRDTRRLRVVDMALFGPDSELDEPSFALDPDPGPEVGLTDEQAVAEVDHLAGQMSLFIDSFPPTERRDAARGLYLDGTGEYRTTHGMLRAI